MRTIKEIRKNVDFGEAIAIIKDDIERKIDELTDRIDELRKQQNQLDEIDVD